MLYQIKRDKGELSSKLLLEAPIRHTGMITMLDSFGRRTWSSSYRKELLRLVFKEVCQKFRPPERMHSKIYKVMKNLWKSVVRFRIGAHFMFPRQKFTMIVIWIAKLSSGSLLTMRRNLLKCVNVKWVLSGKEKYNCFGNETIY